MTTKMFLKKHKQGMFYGAGLMFVLLVVPKVSTPFVKVLTQVRLSLDGNPEARG